MLLFHHLFFSDSVYAKNLVELNFISVELLQKFAIGARVCVWIFAFLSAYGLTCSYNVTIKNGEKVSAFLVKRYFQLLKPYWFVYIIVYLLSFKFFKNPNELYNNNVVYFILDFFGLADFFGTPTLAGVWWYICFSQILLILIPALVHVCRNLGPIGSYLLSFVVLQYLAPGIHSQYGGTYSNYFLVIVLGVICAEYDMFKYLKIHTNLVTKNLDCIFIVFIIFVCIYYKMTYATIDTVKLHTMASSIAACLICVWVYKYLHMSYISYILMTLGKQSGNIYLIHWFIYAYYPDLIYKTRNVVVALLVLLVLSYVIALVIEWIKCIVRFESMIMHFEKRISHIV